MSEGHLGHAIERSTLALAKKLAALLWILVSGETCSRSRAPYVAAVTRAHAMNGLTTKARRTGYTADSIAYRM